MKFNGIFREIYRSKTKCVSWWVYSGKDKASSISGNTKTKFYLFPTIVYEHYDVGNEDEQSLEVSIVWLFWYFAIAKYWGNDYKH